MQEKKHTSNQANRRRFITNTIKLTLLGSILAPLEQACNNKKSPGPFDDGKGKTKSPGRGSKRSRNKWSHESLVMNSKTNVMHFPTSKMYHYYDEIKSKHLKEISLAAWNPRAENAPRLNKQQSGNIMEILTLQELGREISDSTLVIAIDTLSIAFGEEYEKINSTNFRLHELMLQLVALNNMIPADQKWQTFLAKVVKPAQLRKRQKWMDTETAFNDRIKYILDRRTDYINRINQRAKKYSFT